MFEESLGECQNCGSDSPSLNEDGECLTCAGLQYDYLEHEEKSE